MSSLFPVRRRTLALTAASAGLSLARPSWSRAAEETLRAIGAAKGILVGTVIRGTSLTGIPAYAAMVAETADLIVSGNEMQWRNVSPTPEITDLAKVDLVAAWAQAHGIKLRGHALLWHRQIPEWFTALPDRAAALRAMQDHVRLMCKHFAGRIYSWDVVNEALQREPTRSQPMRRTPFLDLIGPDFVEIAFRTAHDADPRPVLVYNEYGVELDLPAQRLKQEVLLDFVGGMKKRGVPVDAVGIQSHLHVDTMQHFNEKQFADFLKALSGLGVKIMLTEMDVADRGAPTDMAQRDAAVAGVYKRYLDVALANRAVIALITWGLTDGDSWVTRGDMPEFIRGDGQPPRPLPFDDKYRRKTAYAAIAAALAAAPAR